mmetsp:Transcript_20179/g.77258  ORF Transcript_20179/g.77258 Transcript_20179/m.77258 type:complete len:216 (-) Transcript_20179:67-714(-)
MRRRRIGGSLAVSNGLLPLNGVVLMSGHVVLERGLVRHGMLLHEHFLLRRNEQRCRLVSRRERAGRRREGTSRRRARASVTGLAGTLGPGHRKWHVHVGTRELGEDHLWRAMLKELHLHFPWIHPQCEAGERHLQLVQEVHNSCTVAGLKDELVHELVLNVDDDRPESLALGRLVVIPVCCVLVAHSGLEALLKAPLLLTAEQGIVQLVCEPCCC